ncbi:hypothetical protein Bca4012_065474 [Brassica carinata]
MDGFVPCKDRKENAEPGKHKDKGIAADNVAAEGQDYAGDVIRDYLNGSKPVDLDEFFDFDLPADDKSNETPKFAEASRTITGALLTVSRALVASRQDACMAQFKAEMADKEVARLKDELGLTRDREGRPSEAEIRRAYRRGKNKVAEMVRIRRERFSCEFKELQASQKALGEYLMMAHNYLYDVEYARKSRRMHERKRDFKIPQIEQRIWDQWDPIPISPDTVEAKTGAPDETGEVDQPAPPVANNQFF